MYVSHRPCVPKLQCRNVEKDIAKRCLGGRAKGPCPSHVEKYPKLSETDPTMPNFRYSVATLPTK